MTAHLMPLRLYGISCFFMLKMINSAMLRHACVSSASEFFKLGTSIKTDINKSKLNSIYSGIVPLETNH